MLALLLLLVVQDTPQPSYDQRLIAAMALLEEGDDSGIEELQDLVKDLRAVTKSPQAKGEDLLTLGTALFHLDRDKEAIEIFDRLIDAGQGDGMAQFYKGLTLAYAGSLSEAVPLLRKTTELKPGFSSGWIELGRVYSLTEAQAEALACYRKALALEPGLVPAMLAAGAACVALDRQDEALTFYTQALARDPKEQTACYNAGQVSQTLGRYEQALGFFTRLATMAPNSWQAWAKQVQLNRALGREEAALTARAKLMTLREDQDNSSLQEQEHYCCEQIRRDADFVMAIELFEPADPSLPYEFLIYDAKRTQMQRLLKLVREPGLPGEAGGGLALIAEYPDGHIDRFPVTDPIQTYAQQRALVLAALDGTLKPKQP